MQKFEGQLQGLEDLDTEEEETRKPDPNNRIQAGPEYGLDFELEYSLAQVNKVSLLNYGYFSVVSFWRMDK